MLTISFKYFNIILLLYSFQIEKRNGYRVLITDCYGFSVLEPFDSHRRVTHWLETTFHMYVFTLIYRRRVA